MPDHVTLALSKPPLSLNDRMHWATKARIVKNVRKHAADMARGLGPYAAATVTLHYQPRDRRKRDRDNLYASLKPCIDGLVDAGVIPGDHAELVEPRVVIHEPTKGEPGRLWLTVEGRDAT